MIAETWMERIAEELNLPPEVVRSLLSWNNNYFVLFQDIPQFHSEKYPLSRFSEIRMSWEWTERFCLSFSIFSPLSSLSCFHYCVYLCFLYFFIKYWFLTWVGKGTCTRMGWQHTSTRSLRTVHWDAAGQNVNYCRGYQINYQYPKQNAIHNCYKGAYYFALFLRVKKLVKCGEVKFKYLEAT